MNGALGGDQEDLSTVPRTDWVPKYVGCSLRVQTRTWKMRPECIQQIKRGLRKGRTSSRAFIFSFERFHSRQFWPLSVGITGQVICH
jgi:hypothetical protein